MTRRLSVGEAVEFDKGVRLGPMDRSLAPIDGKPYFE